MNRPSHITYSGNAYLEESNDIVQIDGTFEVVDWQDAEPGVGIFNGGYWVDHPEHGEVFVQYDDLEEQVDEDEKINTGHWLKTVTPTNRPIGEFRWCDFPRKARVGLVGTKTVATIRYNSVHQVWLARMDGWFWNVTEDMGTSRFKGIKHTPVKSFASANEAQSELHQIWSTRP